MWSPAPTLVTAVAFQAAPYQERLLFCSPVAARAAITLVDYASLTFFDLP
jgi:hypothetical protein